MTNKMVDGKLVPLSEEEQKEYDVKQVTRSDPNDYNLTRRQIRTALVQAGKTASYIDDLIGAMPEGNAQEIAAKEVARIDWQDASYYPWSRLMTVALAASASERTKAEMKEMWTTASRLPR